MSARRFFSTTAAAAGSSGRGCGLVGLPNVGKSTLFNAITRTQLAQTNNFPFCTIKPNVGRVLVPDARLEMLSKLSASEKTVKAQLEVVDIAGLIRGASKGEGLGNQFLANIRLVSVLLHVVRCFDDVGITHVENTIDPVRDAEIVNTELLLADLETLKRRQATNKSKGNLSATEYQNLCSKISAHLDRGQPARSVKIDTTEAAAYRDLQLLTSKPVLYVCNVSESDCVSGNDHCRRVEEMANAEHAATAIVSGKLEEEISQLPNEEARKEFLQVYGLETTGLDKIVTATSKLLGLSVFYTTGEQESRAWVIPLGASASEAAGVIHSDIQRGFIAAETLGYDAFVQCEGNVAKAKQMGLLRMEGRDYVCREGDIFHFRFNV